jgi:hypothetical protein
MARARVNRGEAVPVVNPITHVTLELTKHEAIALRMTLSKIGGSPGTEAGSTNLVTARALTDSIAKALAAAGVPYECSLDGMTTGADRGITYTPDSYAYVRAAAGEWE